MSSSTTIIEHIVLLKAKEDATPTQISTMITALKSLQSLEMVLYLTTGPILRTGSTFTHMVYNRYRSKEDLAAYTADPAHLAVSRAIQPIVDGITVVDWVGSKPESGSNPKPGSAMRVQLVKMKEGLGEREKGEVLDAIGELKEISFGENFSALYANGFSIGSIAVFDGLSELDSAAEDVEIGKENAKIRAYIDTLLFVDYVVP